jgi:6,7-dimethyl-8-ribityllumazine synthase
VPLHIDRDKQIRCDSEADGEQPKSFRLKSGYESVNAIRACAMRAGARIVDAPILETQRGSAMNPRRIATVNPSTARIAFVQSSWHKELLLGCRNAFLGAMTKRGYARKQIECFDVPGAFEIPLHAKLLAKTGKYSAIVASGFVVDGGIYRHDFVATAVINGLMQVQLETEVPVFSVVLTPHQFHEHATHSDFFRAHLKLKGVEAAAACAETLAALSKLKRAK